MQRFALARHATGAPPSRRSKRVFVFGEFELDEKQCELRRSGAPVDLQAKPLHLLGYLLTNRDRVIGKDELLERVWPSVVVSETALSSALRDLRRALGDSASAPRWVVTLRGRGYRFIGPALEHRPAPPTVDLDGASGPLIGRDALLVRFESALEDAVAGRGRIVLLAGEPGIGKTFAAQHFAAVARTRGARVVMAWCPEREGAPPYWPWVQVVRALMADSDGNGARPDASGLAEIANIVPELRERWPVSSPMDRPDDVRFRLFDAMCRFLKTAARKAALVLIIDDLHCADPSSVRFFEFLAREIEPSRLLVLATYRDVAVHSRHPLVATLAELIRQDRCEREILQGLSRDATRALVAHLSGIMPSEEAVERILAQTDGNPLFIRELVRFLAAGGAQLATVPPAVRDVIRGRLERLSRPCRDMLAVASVLGQQFEIGALARISGRALKGLGVDLEWAQREGLVRAIGADRYRFAHALMREALYTELSAARRAGLHRVIGETLEACHAPDLDTHFPELTHHFGTPALGAASAEKAVSYAARAGRRALELLAFEEAELYLGRALAGLERLPSARPRERCDLLLDLGRARASAGRRDAARAAFDSAVAIAREIGDRERLAHAADGFAGQPHVYLDPPALALLEEALEGTAEEDTPLRVRILIRLAGHALWLLRHERVEVLFEEALARARRIADPSTTALVLATRAYLLWGRESPAARHAIATDATQLAESAGDYVTAAWGRLNRIRAWLELGDVGASDAELEIVAARVREGRAVWAEHGVVGYRAMRALMSGAFDEAERLCFEAWEHAQRVEFPPGILAFGARLGLLRRDQGRLAEMESMIRGLSTGRGVASGWRCAVVLLLAELGQATEAQRELQQVMTTQWDALRHDPEWTVAAACLAEACALLDSSEPAVRLYELLLPRANLNAVLGEAQVFFGSVALYLGVLATTLDYRDAAVHHFETALAMHQRMAAEPWRVRTVWHYARLLGRSSRRRDRDRVMALVPPAVESARRLGMRALAERLSAVAETRVA